MCTFPLWFICTLTSVTVGIYTWRWKIGRSKSQIPLKLLKIILLCTHYIRQRVSFLFENAVLKGIPDTNGLQSLILLNLASTNIAINCHIGENRCLYILEDEMIDFSENDNADIKAPSYKLFSLQSIILSASAPTSALDLETYTIKPKGKSYTSVTYRTIHFKLNYFHSYDYGKYCVACIFISSTVLINTYTFWCAWYYCLISLECFQVDK